MANIALQSRVSAKTRPELDVVDGQFPMQRLTLPAAENITCGAPVRIVPSSTGAGKFTNANATDATESALWGIATRTVIAGETVTAIRSGILDGFVLDALDYWAQVWLSDTDGRIADAAGTVNVLVGRVVPGTAVTTGTAYDKLLYVDVAAAEPGTLDSLTTTGAVTAGGAFTAEAAATFEDTASFEGDATVETGATLAVTDADGLTVGGVIVPQVLELAWCLKPLAGVTEHDLWVATGAYQVTDIRAVPSTLEGGALTATIVKAVGTATPVKTTTPMHAADALNLNTGAYTVQDPALTATTADLQLAAGDRIGIDLSAAQTTAVVALAIQLKRI